MIVMALIVIILAITIPCMVSSKINSDETSAMASLRAISQAELQYEAAYGGFAGSLGNLGGADPCKKSPETACLLDQSLAAGVKQGYRFVAVGGEASGGRNTSFVVGAAPEVFDRTGIRLYCVTDKNVLRADPNAGGSTTPPDAETCGGFAALN